MNSLEQELARRGAELLERRLSGFDPRLLARLALLPEWTEDLARAVSLTGEPLAELLERLEGLGLVERRRVLGARGRRQEAFWVRSGVRADLARHVRAVLDEECDRLEAAVGAISPLSPSAQAWLLAVRLRVEPTGLELVETVDRHIEDGDLAAASRLVTAAEVLGQTLGGPLADAARRAAWRVDRLARATDDLEHLRHYLHRQEAEQALTELILGEGEQWALHLLGGGGTGKTMLVRHLASGRFAADRGVPAFPVARADFDHLDPRYPEQRPGLLLHTLADELLGYGTHRRTTHAFRAFEDASFTLEEELGRTAPDRSRVEALLRDLATAFARFVASLPEPVVLVLDTCEELAKLYPPGAAAPGIEHTFLLLELLRAELPHLRVVLAGRRWLVPPPEPLTAGPLLSDRPYVRVLQLGGFTEDEAGSYLARRAPGLPAGLRAAVLARAGQRGDGRYNPFELAAYAHWAAVEPDLDARELLEAPGDPYVERRIVGRVLSADLRVALAVAAELGRFDLDLLTPALLRHGIDPGPAFDALAMYDWVNVVALGADGRARVIEVDEHLRDRLRAVLPPADPSQLGRDAAAVIDATPLPELPVETVEAAVRLLPPAEAGELWERLERRILDGGHWGWAFQVCVRVAAVEEGREGDTVLAAILATQAAAAARGRRSDQGLWAVVAEHAARHPDPRTRHDLRTRALLGLGAVGGEAGAATASGLRRIADDLDHAGHQLIGSVVAALEAAPVRVSWAGLLLENLLEVRDQPATANAAAAVLAVSQALSGDEAEEAARFAELALTFAELPPGPPLLDWEPPGDLLDRCRRARLEVAIRWGEPLDAVPWERWRAEALAATDGDGLAALTVAFELGHRRITGDVLDELGARPPGPLSVELAWAWAVAGAPERGRQLLERCVEHAINEGDADLAERARVALLGLAARCRTTAWVPEAARIAAAGTAAERAAASRLVALMSGGRADPPEPVATGAPGRRGRALLAAAQHLVIADPWRAVTLLAEAEGLLAEAQDEDGANQALVLRVLTEAFSGARTSPQAVVDRTPFFLSVPESVEGSQWPQLARAAEGVRRGETRGPVLDRARRLLFGAEPSTSRPHPATSRGMLWRLGAAVLYAGSALALGLGAMVGLGPAEGMEVVSYLLLAALAGVVAVGLVTSGKENGNVVLLLLGAWAAGAALALAAAALPHGWVRGTAFAVSFLPAALAGGAYAYLWSVVLRHPPVYQLSVDEEGVTVSEPGSVKMLDGGLTGAAGRYVRAPATLRHAAMRDDGSITFDLVEPPGTGPVPMAVRPSPAAADRHWERRLAEAVPPAVRDRLVVYREGYGERASRRAWVAARKEAYLGPPHLAAGRKAPSARGGAFGYRLLHLVGQVVETAAGPRLRVADAAATTISKRVRKGERLIGPELEDAIGLVVLQPEPDERPRGLGGSRAGFLAVAARAFSQGAQAVLVLPTLTDDVAAAVTSALRAGYPDGWRQPYPTELLGLALEVKRILGPELADEMVVLLKTR
ncbi:hypothetical protein GCM10010404_23720 [Nonomuraea africana]|uniref:Orc1-like AAA ATPase domain-containing protein n=1 Tax=Nonomuraea africana TaxID=46171 RepID=A0ABR9KCA6_9ACTN|nr:hypothetical protein [Nonomuraea africana]MBE1559640.1 hypothetical protein [Nonomuraea africana]